MLEGLARSLELDSHSGFIIEGLGTGIHPRFFDQQFGSAVGAIDYVRGSGN